MEYIDAIEFMKKSYDKEIRLGLERIKELLELLGNPQDNLKFVHVAGTNGKGSTSTALSNILKESGKKTGLFISPFVVDFRERVQINGEYISESDLARLTEKISLIVPKVEKDVEDNITEFEFITALMFVYFKEQNCDVVVLEVGLGGRLDSTNVIKNPLATVITKIALEKCGIIKEGCPVITSSLQNPVALDVIKKISGEKFSPINIGDVSAIENLSIMPFGSKFTYKGIGVEVNLPGSHQIENMTTVIETALLIGCTKTAIVNGIAKTKFPARLEIISKSPLVIIDGAHNENGADVLADYLDKNNITPITILGMMADKNCHAVIEKISSRSKGLYTVKVEGNSRAESAENLAAMAKKHCSDVNAEPDYKSALSAAANKAKEFSLPLLICGSLYLASDIRDLAINYFKK